MVFRKERGVAEGRSYVPIFIAFVLGYAVGGGTALVLLSLIVAAQHGDRAQNPRARPGREEAGRAWHKRS